MIFRISPGVKNLNISYYDDFIVKTDEGKKVVDESDRFVKKSIFSLL